MLQPTNKCRHPISDLIERLQRLPAGSTYEEVEGILFGGETAELDLGSSYQMRINVVEGFNPPREA